MREQAPFQQLLNRDKTLRFAKDGTFQITVFSDLHYAEGKLSWFPIESHIYPFSV